MGKFGVYRRAEVNIVLVSQQVDLGVCVVVNVVLVVALATSTLRWTVDVSLPQFDDSI